MNLQNLVQDQKYKIPRRQHCL